MGDENMDLPLLNDLAQVGRSVVSARSKTRSSSSGRIPCLETRNRGNSGVIPSAEEAAEIGDLYGDSSIHPAKAPPTSPGPRATTPTSATALTTSTTLPDSYFVLLELSRIGVREGNREARAGEMNHPKTIGSSASLHSRAVPVARAANSLASHPAAARTSSDNGTGVGTTSSRMAHTSGASKKDIGGGDGAGGTRVKCRPRTKGNGEKDDKGRK